MRQCQRHGVVARIKAGHAKGLQRGNVTCGEVIESSPCAAYRYSGGTIEMNAGTGNQTCSRGLCEYHRSAVGNRQFHNAEFRQILGVGRRERRQRGCGAGKCCCICVMRECQFENSRMRRAIGDNRDGEAAAIQRP